LVVLAFLALWRWPLSDAITSPAAATPSEPDAKVRARVERV